MRPRMAPPWGRAAPRLPQMQKSQVGPAQAFRAPEVKCLRPPLTCATLTLKRWTPSDRIRTYDQPCVQQVALSAELRWASESRWLSDGPIIATRSFNWRKFSGFAGCYQVLITPRNFFSCESLALPVGSCYRNPITTHGRGLLARDDAAGNLSFRRAVSYGRRIWRRTAGLAFEGWLWLAGIRAAYRGVAVKLKRHRNWCSTCSPNDGEVAHHSQRAGVRGRVARLGQILHVCPTT